MKQITYNLLVAIILFGLSISTNAQIKEIPDFTSNELQIRGGLSNFITRANQGNSLKVAYLGGSITEQEGWRNYSLEWFKEFFPKSTFTEINAAIGGTGSDFGAYRLQEHILKYKPDMVFVEFCVNDKGVDPGRIIRSMEGIVRQIRQNDPMTDICFIYTIIDTYLDEELKGDLPKTIEIMEQVAQEYGISSINFGGEVCRQVYNKQLVFTAKEKEKGGVKVFSPDGVHPFFETGQKIYHEVLTRSFKKIAEKATRKITRHTLPNPIDSKSFVNTQMLDITRLYLDRDWTILSVKDHSNFSEFSQYFDKVALGTPNSEFSFRFKGSSFGFFDIIGQGSGKVEIIVDGNKVKDIMRFDSYCTYWRKHYFVVDQLQNTTHDVTIRVLPEAFDKALILSERDKKMKNRAEYIDYNWYAGKILIEGTLLPNK